MVSRSMCSLHFLDRIMSSRASWEGVVRAEFFAGPGKKAQASPASTAGRVRICGKHRRAGERSRHGHGEVSFTVPAGPTPK